MAKNPQQGIGIKSFYSDTLDGLEYEKTASVNCLLKPGDLNKIRYNGIL